MVTKLHFKKTAAQGELTITRLDKFPKNIGAVVEAVDGRLIVGHSETGHHHTVPSDVCELTRLDEFTAYLNVKVATEITHERSFDQHPSIALDAGMYVFRTGREFDPFEETIKASRD